MLSILVENKSGVLTRIAGLFARRGFNIDTLTVGPTDDERISRVTLTVDGALHPIDQVTKQLHKLINVLKIRDLEPGDTVTRELALFKVSADGAQRGELMQITEIFRGKVVDVTKRSVIVEVTGTTEKIEAFEGMVRPFGLIEMMRTGEIAISRGRVRDLASAVSQPPLTSPDLRSRWARRDRERLFSAPASARSSARGGRQGDPRDDQRPAPSRGRPERHRLRLAQGRMRSGSCSSSPTGAGLRWRRWARWLHLSASGPDRFAVVADRWRGLSAAAVADPTEGLGSGPVAVGGFAFAPDGGGAPHWAGL